MRFYIIPLMLIVSIGIGLSQSAKNKVSVDISHDTLLLGNQFQITFELKNVNGEIIEPVFDNAEVLGPNISSQYQNINGDVTQKVTYTYSITPLQEGTFLIPKTGIKLEDEIIETDEGKIVVLPNPEGIVQKRSKNPFKFEYASPRLPAEEKIKSKRKTRKI